MDVTIINFKEEYTKNFTQLNFEWLEKYFYIEEYDKKILLNPQKYILNEGGHILFALLNNEVVGTVALINRNNNVFELSKMAVTSKYQGLKIGKKLMMACIEYAKNNDVKRLFLDSNTKLAPAISLYNKVGFKEISVPSHTPYERCNIRMEMYL